MATKIMYLVDYYEGTQAGTEGQLLQLIQHLDRSRYEPAMTVLRSSDFIERTPVGCQVRVLNVAKLANPRSILKVARFAQTLRREGYRLVHCFLNDVSIIAPPLLRIFGVRVLVSRRDMGFWYSSLNLAVLRFVSLFVDRYVANCQAVRRVTHQREWVPWKKISVIYNGVLLPAATSGEVTQAIDLPKVSSPGPVVGIVANLKPIKRIDVLIRAFAVLCEQWPAARLIVVGVDSHSQRGRSMRKELEDLSGDLGIHEQVIFTGGVDAPAPYVNRFDVAVLCSESEGFSNAILEYMRAGRPIVCTDTGGNPELIQDGFNGFLVPVGDADALADRLGKVLSDSALAHSLGAAARETLRSTYSHARMLREQMACYDAVLSGAQSDQQFNGASRIVQ
jgi:glycosyltransferase involved in cell wall biosynthesis